MLVGRSAAVRGVEWRTRGEVGEDRARVSLRPAVPLYVDIIASANGGVRRNGCGGEVADDFGRGVVGGADKAGVGVGGRPAYPCGVIGSVRTRVVAVVERAVDDNVGEVRVGENKGGESEQQKTCHEGMTQMRHDEEKKETTKQMLKRH